MLTWISCREFVDNHCGCPNPSLLLISVSVQLLYGLFKLPVSNEPLNLPLVKGNIKEERLYSYSPILYIQANRWRELKVWKLYYWMKLQGSKSMRLVVIWYWLKISWKTEWQTGHGEQLRCKCNPDDMAITVSRWKLSSICISPQHSSMFTEAHPWLQMTRTHMRLKNDQDQQLY